MNTIVNDVINPNFSEHDLGNLLKEMYESGSIDHSQTSMIHLFGLKYGLIIRNKKLSIKNIVKESGISDNYVIEINKGIKLLKFPTPK